MANRRSIGLLSASSLVVANMIGTGVFTTSGFLLADLGSPWWVLLAWLVGGLLATMGALCYGALARRIPESGGEYLFLSRTLHPAAGYVAGWISLLVGFSAPLAMAAFAFGEYTRPWLGGVRPQIAGSALLLLFALIHGTHVERGALVQNLAVWIKLLAVALFVALGLSRLPILENGPVQPVQFGSFAVSLVWISFSYSGWNAAVYLGGEIRDPEKNLPRSLLLGATSVMLVYLALNGMFVFSAPVEALAGQVDIGRIAAEALGGARWGMALTGVVALALITSVSSMMMAGPRVYARMAGDGYLPRWLRESEGPPRAAILLQLALSLLMLWSSTFESLLTYIGFTLGLSTAGTVLGLVLLRLRNGREIAIPGWPWVPAVFVASVLLISSYTVFQRPKESLVGFVTMGIGWLGWWFTGRKQSGKRTGSEETISKG
ncbi:MAG TPA: amino acid permease [Verrucomicrobiae bacterium]|nr:amino acid permease [Verrucomicrobiae bacterium]